MIFRDQQESSTLSFAFHLNQIIRREGFLEVRAEKEEEQHMP
jgi:hypothetical protein